MTISLDFQEVSWLLIGTSILLSIIYLWWQLWQYRTIRDRAEGCSIHEADGSDAELPAASIIVYSHNDAECLRRSLPYLLNQDYPEYEVIVVNDGLVVDDSNVVAEFRCKYDNLYETFVPDDTRNVSRRKLALMVGIKAAKHDIIVTTNANSHPTTAHWLRMMCRNFTPGIDIVVGQSVYNHNDDNESGHRYRRYDNVCTRALYTAWGISRKPYRGTCDNLAYRREAFFANKGFSKSMNLHYGDDDIFVSEIAGDANSRVELSPESFVTTTYDDVARTLREHKFRYDFTSRYITTRAFLAEGVMSAVYYLNFAVIGALVAIGAANIEPILALDTIAVAQTASAPLLLLLLTVPHILIFRHTSALLQMPRTFLTVPLFALLRPIVNLRYRLKGRRFISQNFTWQRLK